MWCICVSKTKVSHSLLRVHTRGMTDGTRRDQSTPLTHHDTHVDSPLDLGGDITIDMAIIYNCFSSYATLKAVKTSGFSFGFLKLS